MKTENLSDAMTDYLTSRDLLNQKEKQLSHMNGIYNQKLNALSASSCSVEDAESVKVAFDNIDTFKLKIEKYIEDKDRCEKFILGHLTILKGRSIRFNNFENNIYYFHIIEGKLIIK